MYKLATDEESAEKITDEQYERDPDGFWPSYLAILYWAFETMFTIGYGDKVSKTKSEKIFNILSMIITCCVFTSIMSKIGQMIDDVKSRDSFLNEKIAVVNKYLDEKSRDPSIKIRVRKYLEYVFEEKHRMMQEGHDIICNLSNSLKTEIFQMINSDTLGKISILTKNFNWQFLCGLTNFMSELCYTPDDLIIDVRPLLT